MLKYMKKNKDNSIRTSESFSKEFSSRRSTLKDSDFIQMSKQAIETAKIEGLKTEEDAT